MYKDSRHISNLLNYIDVTKCQTHNKYYLLNLNKFLHNIIY